MFIIILQNNGVMLGLATIIFTFVEIYIQNKILVQVLDIEKNKISKTYSWQAFFISLIRIAMPFAINKIIEILFQMFIYKKYLKCKTEYLLFLECINVIIFSSLELVCVKICETISSEMIFYVCLCEMLFIQFGTYITLKKLEISMDFPEFLSEESKKQIIEILVVSMIIILTNEICMVTYIYNIPGGIYIFSIIFMIAYYFMMIINIAKIIQAEKDKNEINKLTGVNYRLKKSYDDISSFRHDMKNIMQGFGGFIVNKDMEGLEKMYNDLSSEYQEIKGSIEFGKELSENPAIYNLINNKYMEAIKFGINIKVEVYTDINELKIKTYELCRILGILLDNAIEACKECENKNIAVKFLKDKYNNRNLVIIENTCKNCLININDLNKKGFTTKKAKSMHGLGLWRVNQIVKKNENLRLYTSREKIFKQQLEIYNW